MASLTRNFSGSGIFFSLAISATAGRHFHGTPRFNQFPTTFGSSLRTAATTAEPPSALMRTECECIRLGLSHSVIKRKPTIREMKSLCVSAIYGRMANQARDPDFKRAVGARLSAAREILSQDGQKEFAKFFHVTPQAYSQYETGHRTVNLVYLIDLCNAYNLTLDWFYRGVVASLPMDVAPKIVAAHDKINRERAAIRALKAQERQAAERKSAKARRRA